ncbi:hypothetical protein OAR03_00035 [Candidatus Pelagibacter sp.]|nr:hypothetical protein [Candidatus Pelagibacter sp.]
MKKILLTLSLFLFLSGCETTSNPKNTVHLKNEAIIVITFDPWSEFKGTTVSDTRIRRNIAANHCAQFGKFAFYYPRSWMKYRSVNGTEFRCFKNYVPEIMQSDNKIAKLIWTNYSGNETAKVVNSSIPNKKQECKQMGFKEDTEKLAECVLRLVEIDEAKQNNQIQKQRNSEAAIAAMLGTVVQSTTSNNTPKSTCFKTGEEVGGFNKVCRYSCVGNLVTTTIGSMQLCPLTIQR